MSFRDSLDRFEQFATDVILERRFGKRALLLRWFLYALSWLFRGIVQTRLWHRIHAARPIERLVLCGPAVNRFPVENVPADTIVVQGEEDDVVPLSAVLDWARPQQLPVTVFPGCGHFFHGRLTQLQRYIVGLWPAASQE